MLYTALIFGLLGSFHCVGMCGPIAFLLPVDRTNNFKKLGQIFLYHFGRILAYSILGLVFGLVGKSLNLFGFQQQLSIFIGILMLAVIFLPQQTFAKYNFSKPIFKIISKVKSALGKRTEKENSGHLFDHWIFERFPSVWVGLYGSFWSYRFWKCTTR